MIVLLPILVLIVGLVLFVVNSKEPGNAVWTRIGEIMFFAGLLAFLLAGGEQVITFFNR